jgi:dTDP-4-dehydrorhamnose reductase
MSRKLMIFGGSGFIGGNLARLASQNGWDVCIADNRPLLQAEWWSVNVTDKDMVEKALEAVRPTAVVNVAAVADIDLAERERDLAYRVNVEGARILAESCAKSGLRYVFFSSDAVFDGTGLHYVEEDPPNPVNYYGHTKLEAEKAVLKACPQAIIIRLSLVLGFPVSGGNSFLASLESKLEQDKGIRAPADEIRTPVDVITLCECILELCDSQFSGVIHIGATDSISRYDLSRKLARRMGFNENLVEPQATSSAPPGRAPRHKNGVISVAKAQAVLKTRLLSTDEGIKRAFSERLIRTAALASDLENDRDG